MIRNVQWQYHREVLGFEPPLLSRNISIRTIIIFITLIIAHRQRRPIVTTRYVHGRGSSSTVIWGMDSLIIAIIKESMYEGYWCSVTNLLNPWVAWTSWSSRPAAAESFNAWWAGILASGRILRVRTRQTMKLQFAFIWHNSGIKAGKKEIRTSEENRHWVDYLCWSYSFTKSLTAVNQFTSPTRTRIIF